MPSFRNNSFLLFAGCPAFMLEQRLCVGLSASQWLTLEESTWSPPTSLLGAQADQPAGDCPLSFGILLQKLFGISLITSTSVYRCLLPLQLSFTLRLFGRNFASQVRQNLHSLLWCRLQPLCCISINCCQIR